MFGDSMLKSFEMYLKGSNQDDLMGSNQETKMSAGFPVGNVMCGTYIHKPFPVMIGSSQLVSGFYSHSWDKFILNPCEST